MSSNVGVAMESQLRALAKMEVGSKAYMKHLMSLEFAEPMPKVMNRAKKTAKMMPVSEALHIAGKRIHFEVHSLLQSRNVTANVTQHQLVKEHGVVHHAQGLNSATLDKAMAFINEELVSVREEMDLKLFECGFYKVEKEGILYQTQDLLDELAMDISLADATVENAKKEIEQFQRDIDMKQAEIDENTAMCDKIREQLEAEKAIFEDDLRVIDLIIDQTKKECKTTLIQVSACVGATGKTTFEASGFIQEGAHKFKHMSTERAFQQVMFEVYGVDQALPAPLDMKALGDFDYDGADDFPNGIMGERNPPSPAPASFIQTRSKLKEVSNAQLKAEEGPAPTSNSAKGSDQKERCAGVTAKPNCPDLLDKLDIIRGQTTDNLQSKTDELSKHNDECEKTHNELNIEITDFKNKLSVYNTELIQGLAYLSGLSIQKNTQEEAKHQLCKEIKGTYKDCRKDLKAMEREMCGLIKIRQAVYNRVKNPDGKKPQLMITDCEMGDWNVGPCSSTCKDAQGNPGVQFISRAPVDPEWSQTTPEGKYGTKCPPAMVQRDCGLTECPIDCKLGDWSAWGECSKDCGGGNQERARNVIQPPVYGGKECGGLSDNAQCNTDSCDQDCLLSEWSGWGACSKACKAGARYAPGIQFRRKHIAKPVRGNGRCWKPWDRARFEWQRCNNFVCPNNVKCVANIDVLIILDGSGSLWYWYGAKDRNWKMSLKFAKELIGNSEVAVTDSFGRPGPGVRWGIMQYAWYPKVISPITSDKAGLLAKIDKMAWPMGATFTGQALIRAVMVFRMSGSRSRQQIALLVTDGRASNRWWAYIGALYMRSSGIRLIVVPVKGALRDPAQMCLWASKPCSDNMIKTPHWHLLISKLRWYMTTLCPVLEVPGVTR